MYVLVCLDNRQSRNKNALLYVNLVLSPSPTMTVDGPGQLKSTFEYINT